MSFEPSNNNYGSQQALADRKRLEKCIVELETTARHFKIGKVYDIVLDTRRKLKIELTRISNAI